MTFNQLNKEQRDIIQFLLDKKYNFSQIAKSIKMDRTTISKEIKRNRYIKSNFYSPFDKKGISSACKSCSKLNQPPFTCNTCPYKRTCSKHHLYYNSKVAQEHYEVVKRQSRSGVDISEDTIEEIENSIIPLIKNKKQSINQVYTNHSDIIYFSKPTFYKYVNLGIFSLKNTDLPKKVKYKVRKKNIDKSNKRQLALLKGRTYKDFLDFTLKHPKMNICEMDTVEGKNNSKKVLLTIILRETNFMFIRLLEKKNVYCVNEEIDYFKSIGISLYSKVFRIVLTDNGSEFFDPMHIEMDYESGNKKCNVFYCEPYSSWQKGCIEKNHEYIRKVFPKGTSFDLFTKEQIKRLEDTINNIPRNSLNGKTPYELTMKKYPKLLESLDCKYIEPDDVNLSKDYIIKGENK